MDDFFGFLKMGEKPVTLPSSDGFSAAGFIGPVTAAVRWMFWSEVDLSREDNVGAYTRRGKEGSWFYYFSDPKAAAAAARVAGKEYGANQVWRFEMPTSDVLNMFSTTSGENPWGSAVGGDVRITTLRSDRYRHEFHMLALPAFVQALAHRSGILEDRLFHLDELLVPDLVVDDDFQKAMVGREREYADSLLWQRRAALWKALGEGNPAAYNPIGSGTKYDTTSEKLSRCLQGVVVPWKSPLWGRLFLVPDPRVDAVYGTEGKRLSVPCLLEIYKDEGAARSIAEKGREADSNAQNASTEPALPEQWKGYRGSWIVELRKRQRAVDGKLPSLPGLAVMASELSCEPEDIRAWWDIAWTWTTSY